MYATVVTDLGSRCLSWQSRGEKHTRSQGCIRTAIKVLVEKSNLVTQTIRDHGKRPDHFATVPQAVLEDNLIRHEITPHSLDQ